MTIRCLLVMAACFSCLGCQAANPSSPAGDTSSAGDPPAHVQAPSTAGSPVVYAYYFHRTFRCYSCSAMEVAILDVMNEHFAGQMQDGRVVWTPVNIEDPTTKRLQQQLEVRSNGLVLARMENGVYKDSKRMDELWGLKDSPEAFSEYLVGEINARLGLVQGR